MKKDFQGLSPTVAVIPEMSTYLKNMLYSLLSDCSSFYCFLGTVATPGVFFFHFFYLCAPQHTPQHNQLQWQPPLADRKVNDMVSSCVAQYSTLEYQKLFWVVSNLYLYHNYHVREKMLLKQKHLLSPPNMRALL